jgi:hypothetical protein
VRSPLLAVVAASGLILAILALSGVPTAVKGSPGPARATPSASAAPRLREPEAPQSRPTRNLFEYEVERAPQPVPVATPRPIVPVSSPPPTPPPLKLVGIVVQGGEARAALSCNGDVVVLRVGGELAGYAVLAIDEDEGVRLRDSSGEEIRLEPPPVR